MEFIVKEVENIASDRRGGKVQAKSLAAAKQRATRAQIFQRTVMVIESPAGNRLSVKEGKEWRDL